MDANLLASLTQTKKARTLRASSWDTSGRNGDAWIIEGGETRVLADLMGPGCITHIWMTQSGEGAFRNVVLKMFWDGEDDPSGRGAVGRFLLFGTRYFRVFSIAALFRVCECTARESVCAQCRAELLFADAV